MQGQIDLPAGRGTKLYRTDAEIQTMELSSLKIPIRSVIHDCIMVLGTLISPVDHLGIISAKNTYKITIPAQSEYMLINTSTGPLTLKFSQDPEKHEILYDPYLFEKKAQPDFQPDVFKKAHPVPIGYVDTLAKWYSIKYTYPAHNLIFVRPGLGISIQTHKMREEHWEVLEGSPIIIADHSISYKTLIGQKFDIPLGAIHTVINPGKTDRDWVLIKETYSGEFDEEDIVRVFNPNNYQTPK